MDCKDPFNILIKDNDDTFHNTTLLEVLLANHESERHLHLTEDVKSFPLLQY